MPATNSEDQLPRPAIRPYPTQYVTTWTMQNGETVTIRPIRPEDEPMMVRFHQTLSDLSIYLRYFHAMKLGYRVAHERLVRICSSDDDRELVLVAERSDPQRDEHEIIGVARLSKLPNGVDAEFALLVSDLWQRHGLGTEMLGHVVRIARAEKLQRVSAWILPENLEMQRLCEKASFHLVSHATHGTVNAELRIDQRK